MSFRVISNRLMVDADCRFYNGSFESSNQCIRTLRHVVDEVGVVLYDGATASNPFSPILWKNSMYHYQPIPLSGLPGCYCAIYVVWYVYYCTTVLSLERKRDIQSRTRVVSCQRMSFYWSHDDDRWLTRKILCGRGRGGRRGQE